MKKLCVTGLVLVMLLSLAGCGGSSGQSASEGRVGDTMETYFFDFTVNSAYICTEYEGYMPAEGNHLMVADVTVKNTGRSSIEMYDWDFQVQWGDGDEDYGYPISIDTETGEDLGTVSDEQLPGTYSLGVNEERSGLLVYEVPAGNADFSISYLELFDDGSEEGEEGDVYFVYFTAEDRT